MRRACDMCAWSKVGNSLALRELLASRHRKCVERKAHAKLARAGLLVCRVPMYL